MDKTLFPWQELCLWCRNESACDLVAQWRYIYVGVWHMWGGGIVCQHRGGSLLVPQTNLFSGLVSVYRYLRPHSFSFPEGRIPRGRWWVTFVSAPFQTWASPWCLGLCGRRLQISWQHVGLCPHRRPWLCSQGQRYCDRQHPWANLWQRFETMDNVENLELVYITAKNICLFASILPEKI